MCGKGIEKGGGAAGKEQEAVKLLKKHNFIENVKPNFSPFPIPGNTAVSSGAVEILIYRLPANVPIAPGFRRHSSGETGLFYHLNYIAVNITLTGYAQKHGFHFIRLTG